ncbi:MAG: co-chaperone GroES [Patescibacteria group bacterium]
MNKKIVPVGERVLIKPFTEADLRKGGKKSVLILPDSMTKEKSAQGKVLAVGDVKKVKVGDTVLFSKYSYDEIEQDGEELYLLKEENVLAIIKNG